MTSFLFKSPVLLLIASLHYSIVSGHIILESPAPFIWPADGHFNPIDPTGSDWPCKMPSGFTDLQINGTVPLMELGSEQTATFVGLAVHGGGSCQFSLLEGFAPSKSNSDFRVIKSIEGGCPAINQTGNLEDGQSPNQYSFTIPEFLEPGNYTLSWSWVNRITGAPEFYMNCAPVTIVGESASSEQTLKDLPPMFMANIGEAADGCTTLEGQQAQQAISYPNPGSVVEYPEGTAKLIKQTCDGNPHATAAPAPVSSSVSVSSALPISPAPSSTPLASSLSLSTPVSSDSSVSVSVSVILSLSSGLPLSSTASQSAPDSSVVPSHFSISSFMPTTLKTLVSSSPSSTSTAAPTSSSTPSVAAPISASSPLGTPSAVASSTSAAAPVPAPSTPAGTCTDGYLLCLDMMFSTCTGGQWDTPQPLAPGTHCTGGAGVGLTIINPDN